MSQSPVIEDVRVTVIAMDQTHSLMHVRAFHHQRQVGLKPHATWRDRELVRCQ